MSGPVSPAFYHVVVLMPVYEDWECASMVCCALSEELRKLPSVVTRVLLVDDGSPGGISGWSGTTGAGQLQVDVLRLRTNLGHQRAISVGICYIIYLYT